MSAEGRGGGYWTWFAVETVGAAVLGNIVVTGRLGLALPGYAMTLVGLFCWFCCTQELQQLGRTLIGPDR